MRENVIFNGQWGQVASFAIKSDRKDLCGYIFLAKSGGPGRLTQPRAPTDSGRAHFGHPALRITDSLKPVLLSIVVSLRLPQLSVRFIFPCNGSMMTATASLEWVLLAPVPHLRRYYQQLRLPNVLFTSLGFLRSAIPSQRLEFAPDRREAWRRPAWIWSRVSLPYSLWRRRSGLPSSWVASMPTCRVL